MPGGPYRQPLGAATTPADATCALHAGAPAIITCERCGNYACTECAADPYAAVALCRSCAERTAQGRYHVVPPQRAVALYFLTGGVYATWWFYQNWRSIKRHDRSSIWPIPRALFSPFTFFLLINDLNEQSRRRHGFGAALHEMDSLPALAYFVLYALHRLPDPYWIVSIAAGFCLLPVARRIAELEGERAVAASRPLRVRHYVLFAVCALFWGVVALALLFPESLDAEA